MIEMKQLQYFRACVETGNFSKAAELLYTTQPNVSRTIKSLESQLGVSLFERTARGIRPTPEGERVYRYARQILENAEYLQVMSQGNAARHFSIFSTPSRILAALFAEYYNNMADHTVRYKFQEGSAEETVARVETHYSDIGFLLMPGQYLVSFSYHLERRNLTFTQLQETKLLLYAGRRSPLFHAQTIPLETMTQLHFVKNDESVYSLDNCMQSLLPGPAYRQNQKNALVTNSDHLTMQLLNKTDVCHISTDLYVPMMPALTQSPTDSMRGIPIEGANTVSFGYIRSQCEALSEPAEHFLRWIHEMFQCPFPGQEKDHPF